MTIVEFRKGMQKHFGIGQADRFLCPLKKKVGLIGIDVLVFERWFKGLHCGYDDSTSLYDYICKNISKKAGTFLKAAI